MKKFLSCLSVIVVLALVLCSCSGLKNNKDINKVKIGVIETTGYKDKSYIHFFDDDLNFLFKEKNNYSSLSEPFDSPVCIDGIMYAVPKGKFKTRSEQCLLSYDIKTDTYKEYDVGLNSINSFVVTKDNIYCVNSNGLSSTIVKCNINTSECISENLPGSISKIIDVDNSLFAILKNENKGVFLAEISKDKLNIVNQYDITQYGDASNLIEFDNKIYISNQYLDSVSGVPSTSVTVFNRNDNSFSQIDTKEESPNNLVILNNLLFVSHYDSVQTKGNKISVIDSKTQKCTSYEFKDVVKQIVADNNYIYVLGDYCIYKYEFKDNQFTEIAHQEIDGDKSDTYFYVTSFFVY